MAAETTGFNITVSCTQDSTITFHCKTKKRPGIRLGTKVDVTTDRSSTAREYEPAGLIEITPGELTVPDDPELEAKILAVLGVKGTIYFNSRTTGKRIGYSNAWFSGYVPGAYSLGADQPLAVITIESSGGAQAVPALTNIPAEV